MTVHDFDATSRNGVYDATLPVLCICCVECDTPTTAVTNAVRRVLVASHRHWFGVILGSGVDLDHLPLWNSYLVREKPCPLVPTVASVLSIFGTIYVTQNVLQSAKKRTESFHYN